jgi:hypothetical protein
LHLYLTRPFPSPSSVCADARPPFSNSPPAPPVSLQAASPSSVRPPQSSRSSPSSSTLDPRPGDSRARTRALTISTYRAIRRTKRWTRRCGLRECPLRYCFLASWLVPADRRTDGIPFGFRFVESRRRMVSLSNKLPPPSRSRIFFFFFFFSLAWIRHSLVDSGPSVTTCSLLSTHCCTTRTLLVCSNFSQSDPFYRNTCSSLSCPAVPRRGRAVL